MPLNEQQKCEFKSRIIMKLNEKYNHTAQEAVRLEGEYLELLDRLAQQQLEYNDTLKSDSPLTVREVLEMERNGELR
ncbi:NBL1 (YHR199C-A) [Zygosaccharomyces parabailii]|nr:NBL1 (YHR199C-A) [Zygosaccharomyces parabailii]